MNIFGKVALAATVGAGLVGCGGGGAGLVGQQQPRVRLFNGIDNESSISASYQDSTLNVLGTSTAAAYGGLSNDTIITNTNATATVSGSAGALFTTSSTLFRIGDYYTVYTGGTAGNFKSLVLQDTESSAPSQMVGLRVVHVGASTAAVDVYFTPMLAPQLGSTPLFSNLTFGNVSASANSTVAIDENGYLQTSVSQGSYYEITVTAHGSTTPLVTLSSSYTSGNYYTVAVYDKTGGGTAVAVEADHRTD